MSQSNYGSLNFKPLSTYFESILQDFKNRILDLVEGLQTGQYYINDSDNDYYEAYFLLYDIYTYLNFDIEFILPESLYDEIDGDIEAVFAVHTYQVHELIKDFKFILQKISFPFFEGFFTYDSHVYYPLVCIPFRSFNPKMLKRYTMMIVDSGINVLRGSIDYEYPYLEEFINSAEKYGSQNCLWTIPDYPFKIIEDKLTNQASCDYWKQEFLKRTDKNINHFHNIPYTIVPIQYKFKNIHSFRHSWNKYYHFSNYLGIGNLLKCRDTSFFNNILMHIYFNNKESKHVHFFGIGKPLIRKLFAFIREYNPIYSITFDTVKWSITNDKELLKINNGRFCRSSNRNLFLSVFIKNLKTIRKDLKDSIGRNLNLSDFF